MLRYHFLLALKGLRRTPWLAHLMVVTFAVGIAAGMVTITLRHALSMDPIPGKSERLLNLQDPSASYGTGGEFSYAMASALESLGGRHADPVISGLGIVTSASVGGKRKAITGGIGIRYTTSQFFRVFNVPLERGRIWTPAEARAATPVALLSRGTADFLFPAGHIIGKQVRLGTTLFTVIGVTGRWNPRPRYYDLNGPAGAFGGDGDGIFVPVATIQYAPDDMAVPRWCPSTYAGPASPSTLLTSGCGWLSVWYLAHTRHDVDALVQAVASRLPLILPADQARKLRLLNVRQILANADIVPGSVRLYALLGLAFLALCVVNASGMQLSRVLRGAQQVGIRRALGASRFDIINQYLCDALLVGGAGGFLGIGLTFGGLYFVRQLPGVRYADMAHMDGTMFGLMVLLVFVCSVLVGVIPAWIASRSDPALVIKVAQ